MSFSGAPNVIHVSTAGSPTASGADWANAVDSMSVALSKVTGHTLILVAPGLYQNSKGAGIHPRRRLQHSHQGRRAGNQARRLRGHGPVLDRRRHIEFEDLSLAGAAAVGDGSAIQPSGGSEKLNWRIRRCCVKGMRVAVHATKDKAIADPSPGEIVPTGAKRPSATGTPRRHIP